MIPKSPNENQFHISLMTQMKLQEQQRAMSTSTTSNSTAAATTATTLDGGTDSEIGSFGLSSAIPVQVTSYAGISNQAGIPNQEDHTTLNINDSNAYNNRFNFSSSSVSVHPATVDDDYVNTQQAICIPGPYDVTLGRGRRCNRHPGNIRLRSLVDHAKNIYDSSSKGDKTRITEIIVTAVKQNGRFLKEEKFGWVEVEDEVARLKVSHVFRDRMKNNNNNGSSSS